MILALSANFSDCRTLIFENKKFFRLIADEATTFCSDNSDEFQQLTLPELKKLKAIIEINAKLQNSAAGDLTSSFEVIINELKLINDYTLQSMLQKLLTRILLHNGADVLAAINSAAPASFSGPEQSPNNSFSVGQKVYFKRGEQIESGFFAAENSPGTVLVVVYRETESISQVVPISALNPFTLTPQEERERTNILAQLERGPCGSQASSLQKEIIPNLFLSPTPISLQKRRNQHKIAAVAINLSAASLTKPSSSIRLINLGQNLSDDHAKWPLLKKCLPYALCEIEAALSNSKKVFVFCCHTMSISASIVIAFLMQKYALPYDQALAFVQLKQPSMVPPNQKFEEVLRSLTCYQSPRNTTRTPFSRDNSRIG